MGDSSVGLIIHEGALIHNLCCIFQFVCMFQMCFGGSLVCCHHASMERKCFDARAHLVNDVCIWCHDHIFASAMRFARAWFQTACVIFNLDFRDGLFGKRAIVEANCDIQSICSNGSELSLHSTKPLHVCAGAAFYGPVVQSWVLSS